MASFFTKKIVKQFFNDVAKGSQKFREQQDRLDQRDQELAAQDARLKTSQDNANARFKTQQENAQIRADAQESARVQRDTNTADKAVREGAFKAEGIRRKSQKSKTDAQAKLEAARVRREFDRAQQEDRQANSAEVAKAKKEAKNQDTITLRELFDNFTKLSFDSSLRFEDGFQQYKKEFLKETGLKIRNEGDTSRPGPSSGDQAITDAAFQSEDTQNALSTLGAGQNQRPNLLSTGHQGVDLLNQISTGRSNPIVPDPVDRQTDTSFNDPNRLQDFQDAQDNLPAEFPPDFPVIPGQQPNDGSIDITNEVDPAFNLDPQRSEAAAFATTLYQKDEFGQLTDVEEKWLNSYEQAVGLGAQ